MSYHVEDSSRIGQSAYWAWFGGYMVSGPALLFGGLYEIFTGAYLVGFTCIMLMLPVSLYFRVIMMRRCRDIGWPSFLPWVGMGLNMVVGAYNAMSAIGNPSALLTGSHAMMLMPALIGLCDFALTIVIGCIGSMGGTYDVFGAPDFDPRDLPQAPRGYVDDLGPPDLAVRARPLGSSCEGDAVARYHEAPRPVQGFGRRGLG